MSENENKKTSIIPIYFFITIGSFIALILTYINYTSNQCPFWIFILVFLFHILWTMILPLFICKIVEFPNKDTKKEKEDKPLLETICFLIVVIQEFLTLISLLCINNVSPDRVFLFVLLFLLSLGIIFIPRLYKDKKEIKKRLQYLVFAVIFWGLGGTLFYICIKGYPLWVFILVFSLSILFAIFAFIFDGLQEKKEIKNLIISILYILTFIGLIGTLVYVFIEGYPLWSINVVLITTILYLVFGILIADRKDGKRLILWGGLGGILFVGIILTVIFLNIRIPVFLKYLAFPIGYIIGSKLLDKKS